MCNAVKNRYDFMLIYEAVKCNPNGGPDEDNMPRTDLETGHGLVTDVCLKSKIRKYIEITKKGVEGYDLYIKREGCLNARDEEAYLAITEKTIDELVAEKKKGNVREMIEEATKKVRRYISRKFADIRIFGGVMTSSQKLKSNGQILGPVQFGFSESYDPISIIPVTITRSAVTTEEDKEKKGDNTMGNKYIIPYGLYHVEGHVDAAIIESKFSDEEGCYGMTEEDLEFLWEAILNMFNHDNSAARTGMYVKALIVFKHESKYGNCHADKLFDRVKVQKKEGVEYPRKFSDYTVDIDVEGICDGVTVLTSDGDSKLTEYIANQDRT